MRIVLRAFLIIGFLVGVMILWSNWDARRPKDMPSTSIWLDAPYVPFGWNRGWWLGCWIDSDAKANRCRMWNSQLQSVTFEGRYLPCDGAVPLPQRELLLKAPSGAFSSWVPDGHGSIAPAVFLQNGRVLVPIDAAQSCDKLRPKP